MIIDPALNDSYLNDCFYCLHDSLKIQAIAHFLRPHLNFETTIVLVEGKVQHC